MAADSTAGRLSNALRRLLMRPARVAACETLAEGTLITLEGAALQGVGWTPGQKVQVAMSAPFVTRTYTPIDWDPVAGRTRLVAYAHAEGPGSAWALAAQPGDVCDIFGPRGSVEAPSGAAPLALFGDETAIGLAHALRAYDPQRHVTCHFELNDVDRSDAVLGRLDLSDAVRFARRADDGQVAEMETALAWPAEAGAAFVLTGKAATVQRLRLHLKQLGVPASRIATKVYWAPGKSGLD